MLFLGDMTFSLGFPASTVGLSRNKHLPYRVTGAGTKEMTGQLGRGRSTDSMAHATRTRLCWGKNHLLVPLLGNMKIPWVLKVKRKVGVGWRGGEAPIMLESIEFILEF